MQYIRKKCKVHEKVMGVSATAVYIDYRQTGLTGNTRLPALQFATAMVRCNFQTCTFFSSPSFTLRARRTEKFSTDKHFHSFVTVLLWESVWNSSSGKDGYLPYFCCPFPFFMTSIGICVPNGFYSWVLPLTNIKKKWNLCRNKS